MRSSFCSSSSSSRCGRARFDGLQVPSVTTTNPRSLRRRGTTHTNHTPPPLAHTQPHMEAGLLCWTSDDYKEQNLKKPALSFAHNGHHERARDRRVPHFVPTTPFSRTAPYYCSKVPQSRHYKHTQCSNCSLHQASKKAGLKKSLAHTRADRTYREKREGCPRFVRANAISCSRPAGQ